MMIMVMIIMAITKAMMTIVVILNRADGVQQCHNRLR